MNLFIYIDAIRRMNVHSVTVVLTYMGFSRQDRVVDFGQPVSSQVIAKILETCGVDRTIVINLHSSQIEGFWRTLVQPLDVIPFMLDENQLGMKTDDLKFVSPDHGGFKRVQRLAKVFPNAGVIVCDKYRPSPSEVESVTVTGNVDGKDCLIIDDMIDTGGTICAVAKELKSRGSKHVYALAPHALFACDAPSKLKFAVDKLYVANTVVDTYDKSNELIKAIDMFPVVVKVL